MGYIVFTCKYCDANMSAPYTQRGLSASCSECHRTNGVNTCPLELHCTHCDESLEVSEKFVGDDFACPACGNLITLDTSEADQESDDDVQEVSPPAAEGHEHKLRLRSQKESENRNQPESLHISCPYCSESISSHAVICTHCGVDLRTGKKLKTAADKKPFYARSWFIALVVVLGLLVTSFGFLHRERAKKKVKAERQEQAIENSYIDILASVDNDLETAIAELETLHTRVKQAGKQAWAVKVGNSLTDLRAKRQQQLDEEATIRNEAEKRKAEELAKIKAEDVRAREQWEASRLAAIEADKRRQVQENFDGVYQRFFKEFQSPIGKTMSLMLINGSEVFGEVTDVTSNTVSIAKGPSKIILQRDDLRAGSWLICYREDYAKYRANKELGLEQEAYIQDMVRRQMEYDELQKKRKEQKRLSLERDATR